MPSTSASRQTVVPAAQATKSTDVIEGLRDVSVTSASGVAATGDDESVSLSVRAGAVGSVGAGRSASSHVGTTRCAKGITAAHAMVTASTR